MCTKQVFGWAGGFSLLNLFVLVSALALHTERVGLPASSEQMNLETTLPFNALQVVDSVRHFVRAPDAEHPYPFVESERYKTEFTPQGFQLSLRETDAEKWQVKSSIRFGTKTLSYGRDEFTIDPAQWQRQSNSAQREIVPGILERVSARHGEIEWDFVVQRAPLEQGPLEIIAAVDTSVDKSAEIGSDIVRWSDEQGRSFSMGEMVVLDGEKREIYRALPRLDAGSVVLTVPEEILVSAIYPITIDPVISPEYPVSAIGSLNNIAPFATTNPAIASDGDAVSPTYLLVWQDRRMDSAKEELFAARVSNGGAVLDSQGIVVSSAGGRQYNPQVASDGTNFLVTWSDDRASLPGAPVYRIMAARISASSGELLDGPADTGGIHVATMMRNDVQPKVVWNNGNFLIGWLVGSGIYGARIAADGTLLDKDANSDSFVIVAPSSVFSINDLSMAAGGGTALLAWRQTFVLGVADILAKRVSTNGSVLDAVAFELDSGGASANHSNVRLLPINGGFLAAWAESNGVNTDVWAAQITGNVVSNQFVVANSSANELPVALAAGAGSQALVIWSANISNFLARRIDLANLDTAPLLGTGPTTVLSGAGAVKVIAISMFNGNYFVLWSANNTLQYRWVLADTGLLYSGVNPGDTGIFIIRSALQELDAKVAGDGNGGFMVVWQELTRATTGSLSSYVYAALVQYNAGVFTTTIPRFQVATTSGSYAYPNVVWDGSSYLVVWQTSAALNSKQLLATRVNTTGTIVDGAGVLLADNLDFTSAPPHIAYNGTHYLLAWERGMDLPALGISVGQTAIDGLALNNSLIPGPVINLVPSQSNTGANHLALTAYDGDFALAWVVDRSTQSCSGAIVPICTQVPLSTEIRDMRVNVGGNVPLPGAIRISGHQYQKALILKDTTLLDNGNELFIGWTVGDSDLHEVRGVVRDVTGAVIAPTTYPIPSTLLIHSANIPHKRLLSGRVDQGLLLTWQQAQQQADLPGNLFNENIRAVRVGLHGEVIDLPDSVGAELSANPFDEKMVALLPHPDGLALAYSKITPEAAHVGRVQLRNITTHADLELTGKTSPAVGAVAVGGRARYIAYIRSYNPGAVNGARLTVNFPVTAEVDTLATTAGSECVITSGVITCDVVGLSDTHPENIDIWLRHHVEGSHTVTMDLTSLDSELDDSNNHLSYTTQVVPGADLTMTHSVQPQFFKPAVPDAVTMTFTVVNQGPQEAINAAFDLALNNDPALTAITFAATASTGSCTIDGAIITLVVRCNLGNLAVGATSNISVTSYLYGVGDFILPATVSSATPDPDSGASTNVLVMGVNSDDEDGDGILNVDEGGADQDGDGLPDYRDPDVDGDGIDDSLEGSVDTDGDGIPDYRDTDSDNDTIPDSVEGSVDSDGDGIPDFRDTDSDNDGIDDAVENNFFDLPDVDFDGIPNYLDTDSDNDGLLDSFEGTKNTDGDAYPDYLDSDDDGDMILTAIEGTVDSDGDGIPDYLDLDSDADGVSDFLENAFGPDTDGDGIANYLDLDSDDDGIPDSVEGDVDTDGDNYPDFVDLDSDNDTIPDSIEGATDADGDGTPNFRDLDADGDGIADAVEGDGDSDGDGIANFLDTNNNPTAADASFSVDQGVAQVRTFTISDADGDPLLVRIVTPPAKGTVEVIVYPASIAYRYTPTHTETGVDSFTYVANDGKDDSRLATVSITIIPDTTPPYMPTLGLPGNGSLLTSVPVNVSGFAEAGSRIDLYDGGQLVTSGKAYAGIDEFDIYYSFSDGSHAIHVVSVDAAGNSSTASNVSSFSVDTTPPDAPLIIQPLNGFATNQHSIVFSGSAEPNTTINATLIGDGVSMALSTTADGVGSWSVIFTPLDVETLLTLSVTATDAAGHSSESAQVGGRSDFTAPVAPVITTASPLVSNNPQPLIAGKAEAGAGVQLYSVLGSLPPQLIGSTVADGNGDWQVQTDVLEDTPAMASYGIYAIAEDEAGNSSGSSVWMFLIVDTVAPQILNALAGVPGNIVGTQEVSVSVNLVNAESVTLRVYEEGLLLGEASSTSGFGQVNIVLNGEGSHPLEVIAMDLAGNSSDPYPLTVTVDLTPPLAPVITQPLHGSVSNTASLLISGTAEPNLPNLWGSAYLVEQDRIFAITTSVDSLGEWSYTLSAAPEGTYRITTYGIDLLGRGGETSAMVETVIDRTAPAQPIIISPSDGAKTKDATPLAIGSAEPLSHIRLYATGTLIGEADADANGAWQAESVHLIDGSYKLYATATDLAGNVQPATSFINITIDTVAPNAPTITGPLTGSAVNNPRPTFSGTAEVGSVVTLYRDGHALPDQIVANAQGRWSVVVQDNISEGTHAFFAAATDAVGNMSGASGQISLMFDYTLPPLPTIQSPAEAVHYTNTPPVTVSGSAEPGNTVLLHFPADGPVISATAQPDGSWQMQIPLLNDSSVTFDLEAIDPAGNRNRQNGAFTLVIDKLAPQVTFSDPGDGDLFHSNTVMFNGQTSEPNVVVELFDNGVSLGNVATQDNSTLWMLLSSPLTEGVHAINARAVDRAGNVGPLSDVINIAVDVRFLPMAFDDEAVTDEGQSISIDVLANDSDGDPGNDNLLVSQVTTPAHGSAVIDQTGKMVVYTPADGYFGNDNFEYRIKDNDGESLDWALVSVTVNAINSVPVAHNGSVQTDEDDPVRAALSATDADNDSLTYRIVQQPTKGSVSLLDVQMGTFVYRPDRGFVGEDSFTFVANDGHVDSNVATMYITIDDDEHGMQRPELISPEDGDDDVDAHKAKFSWKNGGQNSDDVQYQLQVCDNDEFSGCEPHEIDHRAAVMIIGLGGSGVLLVGLVGGLQRRRRALYLLVAVVIALAAPGCGGGDGGGEGDRVSLTLTDLRERTTYYWKVKVSDGENNYAESEVRSFNTR